MSDASEHAEPSQNHAAEDRLIDTAPPKTNRAPDPALARYYMSGDLRAATGLSRTHLDFYLREGIIRPTARTESGYLLFDDGELATARQVIAWRQQGIGIREIRSRLGRDDD